MRLLTAGSALALTMLMMAGAHAQMPPGQAQEIGAAQRIGAHADRTSASGANTQQIKANESAYSAALRNLPDKKYDPWHGVR